MPRSGPKTPLRYPLFGNSGNSGNSGNVSKNGNSGNNAGGSDSLRLPEEGAPDSGGNNRAPDLPPLPMAVDFPEINTLSNEKIPWGPGVDTDADKRPVAPVQLQARYGEKYNCDFIGPAEPTVTLSFDQGYETGYTPAVLDTLKEKNVQALFFLTGHYVQSQPELVQRMIDEGHILGNHTKNHLNFTKCTPEEAFEDIRRLHDKMREDYNYELRIFRFPEGEFSERALALVQQTGYRTLFWSFAYVDWDPDNQPEPQAAFKKVTGQLHPGEIMLLHTVGKTNSLILGDLIDAIRAEGYEVRPYDAIEAISFPHICR